MAYVREEYSYNNMSCRTTGNFPKKKNEGGDGRFSTTEECDSTTEPVNPKTQFQVGDDVYYQEDTGQNVLGTVGLIQGKKMKIIFMDGTEKWAPFARVKKISFNFADDEVEDKPDVKLFQPNSPAASTISETSTSGASGNGGGGAVSSVSTKKKNKNELNGHVAAPKENYQVTCGSCGTQKMIAPKKAVEFSPYTTHQYNCRKCINKSKTNKNNGVPILAAHYLAAARSRPRGTDTSGGMAPNKSILEHGMANGVFRPEADKICLHCRSPILERVSLHCTMCERPCHPSCLALTPPPLPGDTFWSIICHVCGTQKPDGAPENDSQKLYSSRRSITCWSDVALLLLSCLGCRHPNEKFFHLDDQVIPFWEENLTRLHLPRQYKTADPVERRRCLLVALKNAHLRFLKDEGRDSWGILERTDLNMVIKPPMVSGGRAVTAAGFPISVRANNPEAASAAMTNIAQTIAVQAAANKANNVPTPKNSPSHVSAKSASNIRQIGSNVNNTTVGRKSVKPIDNHNVAKKSGMELNFGAQVRPKIDPWPQARLSKTNFSAELPQTGSSKLVASPPVEAVPLVPNSQTQPNHRIQSHHHQQQQPPNQKQNITLSPSPGGAARVTGMLISPSGTNTTSSLEVGNRIINTGSYPVRKNGSPVLNKSIRVEPVEKRKDVEVGGVKPPYFHDPKDRRSDTFTSSSTGFSNHVGEKLKRKLTKPHESSSQDMSNAAKKLKIGLPSSTDVTSKRLPSPPKSVDSETSSIKNGQKKAMSPLQKLSDLQRNGGLTVACLKHTETGFQTLPMTSSNLEEAIDGKKSSVVVTPENFAGIPPDERSSVFSTPVKSSHGATPVGDAKPSTSKGEDGKDNTKDKPSNVTTSPSPRAFKLASVSTPGSSKNVSPVSVGHMERRVRAVRLKRNLSQTDTEKPPIDSSATAKPITKAKLTAKGKAAALTAAAVKSTRGRPKVLSGSKLQLRKPNNRIVGYHGQFNGSASSVEPSGQKVKENDQIDETGFEWNKSRIIDLLEYGHGYRIGCLPKCPDGPNALEEITQSALKHLKEELTPRPPSYWSSTSNLLHGKKPKNQKSRRDLKDADSYYICGRRIDQNGIQHQVVWRDGYGFEYSSEEEDELGMDFGENYLYFEDYNPAEYFRDKMPHQVTSNGDCDNGNVNRRSTNAATETEENGCRKDGSANIEEKNRKGEPAKIVSLGSMTTTSVLLKIKHEPKDSDKPKSKSGSSAASASANVDGKYAALLSVGVQKSNNSNLRNSEPMIIDLTDSP